MCDLNKNEYEKKETDGENTVKGEIQEISMNIEDDNTLEECDEEDCEKATLLHGIEENGCGARETNPDSEPANKEESKSCNSVETDSIDISELDKNVVEEKASTSGACVEEVLIVEEEDTVEDGLDAFEEREKIKYFEIVENFTTNLSLDNATRRHPISEVETVDETSTDTYWERIQEEVRAIEEFYDKIPGRSEVRAPQTRETDPIADAAADFLDAMELKRNAELHELIDNGEVEKEERDKPESSNHDDTITNVDRERRRNEMRENIHGIHDQAASELTDDLMRRLKKRFKKRAEKYRFNPFEDISASDENARMYERKRPSECVKYTTDTGTYRLYSRTVCLEYEKSTSASTSASEQEAEELVSYEVGFWGMLTEESNLQKLGHFSFGKYYVERGEYNELAILPHVGGIVDMELTPEVFPFSDLCICRLGDNDFLFASKLVQRLQFKATVEGKMDWVISCYDLELGKNVTVSDIFEFDDTRVLIYINTGDLLFAPLPGTPTSMDWEHIPDHIEIPEEPVPSNTLSFVASFADSAGMIENIVLDIEEYAEYVNTLQLKLFKAVGSVFHRVLPKFLRCAIDAPPPYEKKMMWKRVGDIVMAKVLVLDERRAILVMVCNRYAIQWEDNEMAQDVIQKFLEDETANHPQLETKTVCIQQCFWIPLVVSGTRIQISDTTPPYCWEYRTEHHDGSQCLDAQIAFVSDEGNKHSVVGISTFYTNKCPTDVYFLQDHGEDQPGTFSHPINFQKFPVFQPRSPLHFSFGQKVLQVPIEVPVTETTKMEDPVFVLVNLSQFGVFELVDEHGDVNIFNVDESINETTETDVVIFNRNPTKGYIRQPFCICVNNKERNSFLPIYNHKVNNTCVYMSSDLTRFVIFKLQTIHE